MFRANIPDSESVVKFMIDVLPIKEQLAKGKLKIARLTVMNFIFCTGFVVSVIYQNRDISLEDINNA